MAANVPWQNLKKRRLRGRGPPTPPLLCSPPTSLGPQPWGLTWAGPARATPPIFIFPMGVVKITASQQRGCRARDKQALLVFGRRGFSRWERVRREGAKLDPATRRVAFGHLPMLEVESLSEGTKLILQPCQICNVPYVDCQCPPLRSLDGFASHDE